MGDPAPRKRLSEAEYLAIERQSDFKSEFYDGELFAMAGGLDVVLNVASLEVALPLAEVYANVKFAPSPFR